MRMSRRLGIYGGSRKAIITIHGAIGETIDYSGESSGSVPLNEHGEATNVELRSGTYTFVGSISGHSTIVTVKKNDIVKVHPIGAIFWYGNGMTEGDTLWDKCGGWSIAHGRYPSGYNSKGAGYADFREGAYGVDHNNDGTNEAWYSWAENTGSSTHYGVTSFITKKIIYTGYTKICAKYDSVQKSVGRSVIGMNESTLGDGSGGSGVAWTPQVSASISNATNATKSLTLSGESGHFCAAAFGASNDSKGNIGSANNTIYAVWLE